MQIVVATHNEGKLVEIRRILEEDLGVDAGVDVGEEAGHRAVQGTA